MVNIEAEALRAIARWPFMSGLLCADDFGSYAMRAVFVHLASGRTLFELAPRTAAYSAMVDHDLWDMECARTSAVSALLGASKWSRRREALLRALSACESENDDEWELAAVKLRRTP